MEPRRSPRVRLELGVTLTRRRGSPVVGHTEDVGVSGARVVVDRPLSVDEELLFDLEVDREHVDGRARVVRQQGIHCYALRFEELGAQGRALLGAVVSRTT